MHRFKKCMAVILMTLMIVPMSFAAVFADEIPVAGTGKTPVAGDTGSAIASESEALGAFGVSEQMNETGTDQLLSQSQNQLQDQDLNQLLDEDQNPDQDQNPDENPDPEETVCPDGEHVWDNGTVTRKPTCVKKGKKEFTCTVCGEKKTTTIAIDPDAHNWGKWKTVKKATNITKGTKKRTCSLCGKEETKSTAKLKEKRVWQKVNGKWYYFGADTKGVKGWHRFRLYGNENNHVEWCWFNKNGKLKKHINYHTRNKWVTVGSKEFYFDSDEYPVKRGFRMIRNKLYYFRKDMSLVTGRFKAKDGKYYTTNDDGSLSGEVYYQYKYKTLVFVDISEQQLRYYENKKCVLEADVVTGTKGSHDTPTGIFRLISKSRNVTLVGPTWNSFVSYWMYFRSGGYGIHDASWRTSAQFSNHKTYITNGSHGCVNMRPKDAGNLYNRIKTGTVIIIRK